MRNAFADEITALAGEDERVVLLSGDIGNRLFDCYKARYPDRFYNCGVAEANMTGVAAGMAMGGLRPVTYSIVPFVTTRCLEQIRVDVCYHNVPVTIVGVGGGLAYAELGATHHSCEDIAFLRMLPGMSVVCPADPVETRLALRAALHHDGPVYLRLGKKGEPVCHSGPVDFQIGTGITVRSGTDVCLLSTGILLSDALDAAEHLAREGMSTRVVSFHTVKPLDHNLLMEAFTDYPLVVSLEEHSRLGGLGGSIAEWLTDNFMLPEQPRGAFLRLGTADTFLHQAGDDKFARHHFGLSAEGVAANILAAVRRAPQ